MGFMDQAWDQAGREFGARHWKWFAAARILRRAAPGIAVVVILGALVLGYRLISPDWSAISDDASGAAPVAAWWALGALGLALLVAAGVGVWRAYGWRWRIYRPGRW